MKEKWEREEDGRRKKEEAKEGRKEEGRSRKDRHRAQMASVHDKSESVVVAATATAAGGQFPSVGGRLVGLDGWRVARSSGLPPALPHIRPTSFRPGRSASSDRAVRVASLEPTSRV